MCPKAWPLLTVTGSSAGLTLTHRSPSLVDDLTLRSGVLFMAVCQYATCPASFRSMSMSARTWFWHICLMCRPLTGTPPPPSLSVRKSLKRTSRVLPCDVIVAFAVCAMMRPSLDLANSQWRRMQHFSQLTFRFLLWTCAVNAGHAIVITIVARRCRLQHLAKGHAHAGALTDAGEITRVDGCTQGAGLGRAGDTCNDLFDGRHIIFRDPDIHQCLDRCSLV